MPQAAPRACPRPQCGKSGAHRHTDPRGSSTQQGYDARWRRARLAYLKRHPLCVIDEREGRVVAATIVDHIVPHRGDELLFWDETNWQSLCKSHHDRKTALEQGRGRSKV